MAAPLEQRFLTVARILRPRGNKGEISAELLTDFPDRLKQLPQVFLSADSSSAAPGLETGSFHPRQMGLRSFWQDRNHPGHAVFHFGGVDSISEAQKLRGLLVQIPFEQRVALPAGSYFVTDLIGCAVFELAPSVCREDL